MQTLNNSVLVIFPYCDNGIWRFDDEATGLKGEPFVGNVNRWIDKMVKNIPFAHKGVALFFSPTELPKPQMVIDWVREEAGGNIYTDGLIEGWFCPALYKYFTVAPKRMYAYAEPLRSEGGV
jgi:hypothetical protein